MTPNTIIPFFHFQHFVDVQILEFRLWVGRSGVRIPAGKRGFSSAVYFRPAVLPIEPNIRLDPGLFLTGNDRGVMLTTHRRLEQRLRMSGCVLVLPLYAFMV
jgi:hypothetical protein